MTIPKRPLGRTGHEATIMGLGGEGILRTYGCESQAYELINRAIDLGINYKSDLQHVLPVAKKRNMGIIAMKTYVRGFASRLPCYTDMEPFFRFALSQPVTLAVIGCDNLEQLEENVNVASSFVPWAMMKSRT